MFTHLYVKSFIGNLSLPEQVKNKISDVLEREGKMDALLSMVSDMMPLEKYPAIYQGLLEAPKSEFYQGNKTRWCHDNRKYFNKFTSRVNNLIRMERVDLIEELIRGNGGEFIQRDTERMNQDRRVLMSSYFEPLNPEWEHVTPTTIVQIYQVPIDSNPIMRNHKGLLASMKIPKQQGLNYIILSRINSKDKYNYSVRTNLKCNLQKLIKDKVIDVEIGGHDQAFGVIIPKKVESQLKEALVGVGDGICDSLNSGKNVISYKDILGSDNPLKMLWDIALQNEVSTYPTAVKFHYTDFIDIEVFTKRTVYYLKIEERVQEVVSFDLEEKEVICATPLCKENIYSKYNMDILEVN